MAQLQFAWGDDSPRPAPEKDICAGRHGGVAESQDAFERVKETLPGARAQVLDWIRRRGHERGTAKEYAAAVGKSLNCVSGRYSELARDGLIRRRGDRRDEAAVWVVV